MCVAEWQSEEWNTSLDNYEQTDMDPFLGVSVKANLISEIGEFGLASFSTLLSLEVFKGP